MPQPKQQVFKQVIVRATDINDAALQEQIESRMMAFEQSKMAETQARIALMRASAKLLRSQAERMEAHAALQESFGEGDSRVALEPNWEPFRDGNTPAMENFLSERDQRNMIRLQKVSANRQVEQMGDGNYGDMFEQGEGQ